MREESISKFAEGQSSFHQMASDRRDAGPHRLRDGGGPGEASGGSKERGERAQDGILIEREALSRVQERADDNARADLGPRHPSPQPRERETPLARVTRTDTPAPLGWRTRRTLLRGARLDRRRTSERLHDRDRVLSFLRRTVAATAGESCTDAIHEFERERALGAGSLESVVPQRIDAYEVDRGLGFGSTREAAAGEKLRTPCFELELELVAAAAQHEFRGGAGSARAYTDCRDGRLRRRALAGLALSLVRSRLRRSSTRPLRLLRHHAPPPDVSGPCGLNVARPAQRTIDDELRRAGSTGRARRSVPTSAGHAVDSAP